MCATPRATGTVEAKAVSSSAFMFSAPSVAAAEEGDGSTQPGSSCGGRLWWKSWSFPFCWHQKKGYGLAYLGIDGISGGARH